jgi:DNA polymerase-3 subunit gamma/tau
MSYEVLARRWRPQTFDEVAGQSHVTTALRNAIELDRVPHAILLTGPRGVGKTSIARILARSLNCDEGPTVRPCGQCSPCREIAGGTSLDVQEIDAASHTGVENVREIRESIRFAAAPGKHRIFIIDEVHMLSGAAFNALLKTLEEPPPSSLFIFATTDPQKIPSTVLSRVQRFDLKRLSSKDWFERLSRIIQDEQLEIPEAIVRALVREADGSGRDSLTLLDRLTSALGSKISEQDARAVLDLVDRRVVSGVLDAVLEQDPAAALERLRDALDKGIEPARLAAELLQEIRDLLVSRVAGDAEGLVDAAPEELEELRVRARAHDAETFQRLFRVLLARQQDLAWAPRPSHALEMAVVRLATLPTAESLQSLLQRLDALGPGAPGGGGSAGREPARRPESGRGPAGGSTRPRGPARASAPAPESEPAAALDTPERRAAPAPDAPTLEPRAAAASPSAPARSQEGERLARLKAEARSHPAVLDTIQALDAELKEIRLREKGES